MSMYDRDWYRDHHKKLNEQQSNNVRLKRIVLRKPWIRIDGKGSIWVLLFKTILVISGLVITIELALRAKGIR